MRNTFFLAACAMLSDSVTASSSHTSTSLHSACHDRGNQSTVRCYRRKVRRNVLVK